MATILSEAQCSKIRVLRNQFKPYADRGWMCEGGEHGNTVCNTIFNNDTDEFFKADYNGNILCSNLTVTSIEDAKAMARIEGAIRHLV